MSNNKGIFVVGTGTDIGKTHISALLVKHLLEENINVNYYKAVSSEGEHFQGETVAIDALYVHNLTNLTTHPSQMASYIYQDPVSPHLAVRKDKNFIDLEKIRADFCRVSKESEFVVAEGCGGILCPLVFEENNKVWLEDIIKALQLPVLVVADSGLGTINATGLTISYLKQKDFKIKGIVLNRFDENNLMHIDNKKVIEESTKVPVIATVKINSKVLDNFNSKILYQKEN